ncbi:N-acetylmuramoyl-L-alanine amidase, partial [Paenibacillus sp. MCAF20]
HLIAGTKLKDRGVKKEAFKVIKETTMPAVLVEAGFLSNAADAKLLYDDAVQNRIAAELVAGIKEYFKLK